MKRRLWHQFGLRTLFVLVTVSGVGLIIWSLLADRPTRISGLTIMNHSGENLQSAQVINPDGSVLLNTVGQVNLVHDSGFGQFWSDEGPLIGKRVIVTWTEIDGSQHRAALSVLHIKEGAEVIIEIGSDGTVTGSSGPSPFPKVEYWSSHQRQ
jgi:hypothetical protein